MMCKNTSHPHECHPLFAKKYDGFCQDCANAGVPDLLDRIADLEAALLKPCAETVSTIPTAYGEMKPC